MGTLRKAKLAIKTDHDLRQLLLRGGRNEILLDLDGDKEADVVLLDSNGDGNIDTFGADVYGTGDFNLYIEDTDHNGVPDTILVDEEGTGDFETLASGAEVEANMIEAAQKLAILIEAKEIIAEELDQRLKEMDKEIRRARIELAKRH